MKLPRSVTWTTSWVEADKIRSEQGEYLRLKLTGKPLSEFTVDELPSLARLFDGDPTSTDMFVLRRYLS